MQGWGFQKVQKSVSRPTAPLHVGALGTSGPGARLCRGDRTMNLAPSLSRSTMKSGSSAAEGRGSGAGVLKPPNNKTHWDIMAQTQGLVSGGRGWGLANGGD